MVVPAENLTPKHWNVSEVSVFVIITEINDSRPLSDVLLEGLDSG